VKHAWVVALHMLGATAWARRRLGSEGAIIVLMFHRVLDDGDFTRTNSLPGMVMRGRTFASLTRRVKQHADIIDAHHAQPGQAGKRPRVVFTFDDGWLDNATVAWPIAHAESAPFTIFVCPELMDTHEPFWTERAVAASGGEPAAAEPLIEELKRLPPADREARLRALSTGRRPAAPIDRTMGWNDVARLRRGGVSFGSHSSVHEILTFLDRDALLADLTSARREAEARMQCPCPLLAYPNGGTSAAVESAAAAAGHTLAFTTVPRAWTVGSNPYQVPRINMWEGKITSPFGRFSGAALDYTIYWRPFVLWLSERHGFGKLQRFFGARTA
jgi:peptidoglycan/xylan/chitin deacetylase (PgdA/CDA1 family)